jgi:uncharacterized protein HemX
MFLDVLAQASSASNGDTTVVTIVYVLTGISLIIGFAVGTYKYVQRQKKKWTEEGITRQKQQQAMTENTAMMQKNTQAIDRLSVEFTKFATSMRTEMNGLGDRIGKLETWKRDREHPRQASNE